jgi:acyl-CoA synthetase (AMP-forming)/AMP-acid ligase II
MAQPRPGTLEALAAAAPDGVVITEHESGRSLTRQAWDERAGALAAALAQRDGIGHGSRVALDFSRPTLGLFEATFALAKLGAVPIHLPRDADGRALGAARELARADVCLQDGAAHDDLIAGAPDGSRPISGVRVAPSTVTTGAEPPFFHERLDDRGDRSGLAVVLGDLIARARHRQGAVHLVAAPTWIPATLTHANVALLAGGPIVLLTEFSPSSWLEAVAEHEVNTAVLTAGMLTSILALPQDRRDTCDVTSLDAVLVVDGPVARPARLAAVDLFGEDQVALLYATPAAGPVAVLDPADVAEDPGTVGAPLRGVHVTIRDDAGTSVPRGTVGQIHVTSPLATGEDVATGDRGYRDAEGRLCVVD